MKQRRFWKQFWKQVDVRTPLECWGYKGPHNKDGYGIFSHAGYRELAHRLAWISERHPIPKRKNANHLCVDNPGCCNPDHLYIGTQADNVRDANRIGSYDWKEHLTPIWVRTGPGRKHKEINPTIAKNILELNRRGKNVAYISRESGVSRHLVNRLIDNTGRNVRNPRPNLLDFIT